MPLLDARLLFEQLVGILEDSRAVDERLAL
jgi:hypothetical protein